MKITIAEPLRPFSHQPGASCIIPHSGWQLTAFPSLIQLRHLKEADSIDLHLSLKGPVTDFTVQQDLEGGRVTIFGVAQQGYFRFVLKQEDLGLCFYLEKIPVGGITLSMESGSRDVQAPDMILLNPRPEPTYRRLTEKLSLGNHKSQDFAVIRKRAQMAEIFPHWLKLGQMIPHAPTSDVSGGVMQLINDCSSCLQKSDAMSVMAAFKPLFLAGFFSILSPRLIDDEYQGIISCHTVPSQACALDLLSKGAEIIRALFFTEEEDCYYILPCLPSEFHCGRFIGIKTLSGDQIDIAWSKKQIRSIIVQPMASKEISFCLQKSVACFRLRTSLSDKGVILAAHDRITCKEGQTLYLDRFQK